MPSDQSVSGAICARRTSAIAAERRRGLAVSGYAVTAFAEEHVDRPNNRSTLARRHFVAGVAAASLAPLAPLSHAQGANRPSPTQTLGPFYPRNSGERPRNTDADLITVDGDRVVTKGTPLFLIGRVSDRSGAVLVGAAVEIWQCDANAVYHHPAGGAEGERDATFQGYGVDRTDSSGEFRFRTIIPVAYPGRTPHIHVRVQPISGRAFATQLYLPGDSGNAKDFLFSRLTAEEQRALLLVIEPTRNPTHPLARATRFTGRTELVLA
jgi:protocatechuate 3,4-dioxygenase beta subunit